MLIQRRGLARRAILRRFIEVNARKQARRVFLTEGVLDTVLVATEELYAEALTSKGDVEPQRFIDALQGFLQFLIDNKEVILELIEVILGLF
jgi:hypothetical protein